MSSLRRGIKDDVVHILLIGGMIVYALGLSCALGFEPTPPELEPDPVPVVEPVPEPEPDTIMVRPPAGVCWSVEPEADVCTYLIETR